VYFTTHNINIIYNIYFTYTLDDTRNPDFMVSRICYREGEEGGIKVRTQPFFITALAPPLPKYLTLEIYIVVVSECYKFHQATRYISRNRPRTELCDNIVVVVLSKCEYKQQLNHIAGLPSGGCHNQNEYRRIKFVVKSYLTHRILINNNINMIESAE